MPEFKFKFKPGDVVRCVDSFGASLVSEGEKYTVHAVKYNAQLACTYLYFSANDFEGARGLNVNRFELVKSADNPFKVGDKVMLKDWERFYEILEVKGDKIKLKSSDGEGYWYGTSIHNFEKESTMKFDTSKKYRMTDTHEPVRIICTDKKDPTTPYIGLRATDCDYEVVMYLYENDCRIEEVPQVDWSKVEVDTPIWVDGMPVHFAEFHNGRVWFFQFGRTSHSLTTGTEAWCYPEHASLENPCA